MRACVASPNTIILSLVPLRYMALVTFSGYPCSGKTRRADQLKDYMESRLADPSYSGPLLKVIVLSDDTLNIDRSSYNGIVPIQPTSLPLSLDYVVDSHSEKLARSVLFTTVQRQMARDTILVVDALNYIKGFRYQLHCAAREFKLRVCTVGARLFSGETFTCQNN